jgi:hypothetical protein
MKKLVSVVVSASSLLGMSVVSAFAQGYAGAVPQVYGSVWAAKQTEASKLSASPSHPGRPAAPPKSSSAPGSAARNSNGSSPAVSGG